MATARIDGETLHVELKGADVLWAVHGSFAIPVANIRAASADRPPGFWDALKIIGTNAGRLKMAGTFVYHGELVFFDYTGNDDVLVLDLVQGASRYRHLFVGIDPPDTPRDAVARINAALPTRTGE